jgi:hypothetical protein
MSEFDPIELSRTLSHAEDAAWAWKDRLPELAIVEDAPLQEWRSILSQRHYTELGESLKKDDPLRPALFRWLAHLIEARVNAASTTRVAHLRYHEEHSVDAPERLQTTVDALSRRVLHDERRKPWLQALAHCSPQTSDAVRHHWQRRVEVYQRLGGPSLDEAELPSAEAYELADEALTLTQPLTQETNGLFASLERAVKPSVLTFPAHLNGPTLAAWFRETRLLEAVRMRGFNWPKPIAPTSFGLALDRFGQVWQRALMPRNQPFVIACDPLGLGEHTTGWLFASLLANPTFQRRHLEGSPAKQRDIDRHWGLVGVHELRVRAVRVLTRQALLSDHRERPSLLAALGERAWGEPLPDALVGVLPQLRADDAQRFYAIALGTSLNDAMVEAHDQDWFRNPRAVDELRANAARPCEVHAATDAVRHGLTRYVQRLTTLIG